MNIFLQFFLLLPLLGFVITILIPEKKERLISWTTFSTVLLQLLGIIVFSIFWIIDGATDLNLKEITLLKTTGYEFFIDFYFDKISAVYLILGSSLTFMVTTYSRYYLHREKGYKRFFNTVLFFFFGFNLAILSGNFETLFVGWEIIGISSFLLIAFYRERYLPVKNAFKVYSVYRIGDIGIILAMWASHHLWHENITFMKLNNYQMVSEHIQSHSFIGVFISLAIVLAAAAKSAQLPFSSWLPRAMEGPTPSSAIFYGSLSVHLGVFLMLRTFPFWEHQTTVRVLVVLMGLSTSIAASLMASVQSSVKSQVAYSSIAQIGLIFIEIALGLETVALFHIVGNAFLRTYQLLVSPSVVSYLIREQFYTFEPKRVLHKKAFVKKMEYSLYMLSLKEFKLETFMNYFLWRPLKTIGKKLDFLSLRLLFILFVPTYLIGVSSFLYKDSIPYQIIEILPELFSFLGLILIFKAFSERESPLIAWVLIIMNSFWTALAISFNDKVSLYEIGFYLSGIIISGFIGYVALLRLNKIEVSVNLNQYSGHSFEHPKFAFFFLISLFGCYRFSNYHHVYRRGFNL